MNGNKIKSIPPGTICGFSCRNRYILSGSTSTKCVVGPSPTQARWNTRTPTCVPNPQCNEMQAPEFGTKVCTQDGPLVDVGRKCNFECNKRFKLIGSMESQCVKDAGPLKAYFDNDPPVCKRNPICKMIAALLHGNKSCNASEKLAVRPGTYCSFYCDPGYFLFGKNESTCTEARNPVDSAFNNPTPKCNRGNISLGLFWNRISLLSNDIISVIPRWYNYVYDHPNTPQTRIFDGGDNMYDLGNLVRFYEDSTVPENPLPYNSELIGSTFHLQVGGTTHPFMMLAWITNKNRTRHSYIIDVRSNTGADGGGSIAIYNGNLTEGSATLEYHSFQIHGASDPSICEVYFTMYSQAKWGSIPGQGFDVAAFSARTDPTSNTVVLSGTPSNVLMGYMLLSRISGGLITRSEVQRTLLRLMQRLQGQASNLEELKSKVVNQTLDAIKRSNPDLTTSYHNWYNYTYDGGVNFIEDGDNDMYDGANRIYIYEDGSLEIAQLLYNQLYKSSNFEFQSSAGEPFISILWISNDNNRTLNITLQVKGDAGAAGYGVITNLSGKLTSGDYRMSYHVFEIHETFSRPPICEVYFAVHNTAVSTQSLKGYIENRKLGKLILRANEM
ncbi:unnamed protein product [Clavelina lepadiformis]|uniref:Sushi domain-containing protein n=1 Tax=Clavelina lepadiformis TaxID=159417 RepID=A0ABP0F8Z4_CLALP